MFINLKHMRVPTGDFDKIAFYIKNYNIVHI